MTESLTFLYFAMAVATAIKFTRLEANSYVFDGLAVWIASMVWPISLVVTFFTGKNK